MNKKNSSTPVLDKEAKIKQLRAELAKLEEKDDVTYEEISLSAQIKVMSLVPYILNLSTGEKGKPSYKFKRFGEIKKIIYSDILKILEAHDNFLRDGLFIILDKRVIENHGLQDVNEQILTKEKILSVIKGSDGYEDLYKSATESQKDVIVSMIVDLLVEGETVDLNVIDKLSRASGIKIVEKAEDAKAVFSKEE